MTKYNSISQFFLGLQIQDFYNYVHFMENNIDSHKKRLEKEFESQSQSQELTTEERQELFENLFLDPYHDVDSTYTLLLRKSLFLTLYAFVETELRSISVKLENQEESKIKLSDISHRGLFQYLFYIETVHNIPINITEEDREKFIGYNLLRNHFVHNDRSPIKLRQYKGMTKIKGIVFDTSPIDETKYYVDSLTKEFNEFYLDLISNFFNKLYEGLSTSENLF